MIEDNMATNRIKFHKLGRNDPCPCGSGKKYKNCCLQKTETVSLSNYKYDRYLEIRRSASIKVFDIGIEKLKLESTEPTFYLFDFLLFNPDKKDKLRNEQEFEGFLRETSLLFLTHGYPIFEMDFNDDNYKKDIETDDFGFDFINTDEVHDNYLWKYSLKHYPDIFTEEEKHFIETLNKSVNGFFKVTGITDKDGKDNLSAGNYPVVEVEDIFTKKHYRLIDIQLSGGVVKHDIVSGLIVPYDFIRDTDLYILEGSPPILYPPLDEPLILDMAKEYCRTYRKEYKSLYENRIEYSRILKDFPVIIYLVSVHYFYHLISKPLPKMVNYDKEELIMSASAYRVIDRDEVKRQLIKLSDIRIVEETKKQIVFSWSNEKNTILGTIFLKEKSLSFETNSLERLERFKKKIQKLPLEFDRTDYTYVNDLLGQPSKNKIKTAEVKKAEKKEKLEIPEAELEKIALKWWEDYYNDWVSIKIPAIGNITPLEAIKTKEGRKKVEALINDYENKYLHDSKREDNGVNIQKYFNPDELRKRLF